MDVRTNNNQSTKRTADEKKSTALTFKAGKATNASSTLMLPKPISSKLTEISNIYGLPLDLGNISLIQATPENVKGLRNIVTLISNNSKLLPDILKLLKQLLAAEIQLSDFHKKATKAALEHQTALDKDSANMFLQMAGYASSAAKLQHRTNTRNDLITKRTLAYEEHYKNSVFGNQSQIIDAEYQLMASNSDILRDSKVNRLAIQGERKKAALAYIDSAFAN